MSPVERNEWTVTGLSPLRERRLLRMAWIGGFNHKAFYSQYCRLMADGLVQWVLGSAFLTEAGKARLAELESG